MSNKCSPLDPSGDGSFLGPDEGQRHYVERDSIGKWEDLTDEWRCVCVEPMARCALSEEKKMTTFLEDLARISYETRSEQTVFRDSSKRMFFWSEASATIKAIEIATIRTMIINIPDAPRAFYEAFGANNSGNKYRLQSFIRKIALQEENPPPARLEVPAIHKGKKFHWIGKHGGTWTIGVWDNEYWCIFDSGSDTWTAEGAAKEGYIYGNPVNNFTFSGTVGVEK